MVNRLFQSTMQPFQQSAHSMLINNIDYTKNKQNEKVEMTENSQLNFSSKPLTQRLITEETTLPVSILEENCGKYSTMQLNPSTLNNNWQSDINLSTSIYNPRHLENSKYF